MIYRKEMASGDYKTSRNKLCTRIIVVLHVLIVNKECNVTCNDLTCDIYMRLIPIRQLESYLGQEEGQFNCVMIVVMKAL